MSHSHEINNQEIPSTPESTAMLTRQSGRIRNVGRKVVSFFKDGYKPVSGGSEDQVRVLTSRAVRKRWGNPTVDFAGLTEMVKEAGLPEDTRIKLYSGRLVGGTGEFKRFTLGARVPLTNTIYSAVGPDGHHSGLPHRYDLPESVLTGLEDHSTATMSKLTRNILKASGVCGSEQYERERDLYEQHAGVIQFKNPSPDAR